MGSVLVGLGLAASVFGQGLPLASKKLHLSAVAAGLKLGGGRAAGLIVRGAEGVVLVVAVELLAFFPQILVTSVLPPPSSWR